MIKRLEEGSPAQARAGELAPPHAADGLAGHSQPTRQAVTQHP